MQVLLVQHRPAIRLYKFGRSLQKRGHRVLVAHSLRSPLIAEHHWLSRHFLHLPVEGPDDVTELAQAVDVVVHFNANIPLAEGAVDHPGYVVFVGDLAGIREDFVKGRSRESELLRRARGLMFVSTAQQQMASDIYGDFPSQKLVVDNGVVEEMVADPSTVTKLSAKDSKIHVVYSGGMSSKPGTSRHVLPLIEALIDEEEFVVHLIAAAGSSVSEPLRKQEIASDRLRIEHTVPSNALVRSLARFDVGLIYVDERYPSIRDTMRPNKLFEYLAAGLPVAANRGRALQEYLERAHAGVVFDTLDGAAAAVRAAARLAAERGWPPAVETYESQGERIEAFLQRVLAERAPSPQAPRTAEVTVPLVAGSGNGLTAASGAYRKGGSGKPLPLRRLRWVLRHPGRFVWRRLAATHASTFQAAEADAHLIELKRDLKDSKRKVKTITKTLKMAELEVAKAARFAYGSYTPGMPGWHDRWQRSGGKRVLFVASQDTAGSMIQWAHALNRHTDYAVRLAVFRRPRFEYESDLLLPSPSIERGGLDQLLSEADVVQLKDEAVFENGLDGLPPTWLLDIGKRTIFTCDGAVSRMQRDNPEFRRHALQYTARVVLTPDLNFPWLDGVFVPHAIDCARFPFSWSDGDIVAVSPSEMNVKATRNLVAAVSRLDLDLSLDLITGVPNYECLERKRSATLFFDQAGEKAGRVTGWYGHSAVEAAAFGIPTLAHLCQEALEQLRLAGDAMADDLEIIGTGCSESDISAAISDFFGKTSQKRMEKALATRAWVERHHDYPAVAKRLAAVYDGLLPSGKRSKRSATTAVSDQKAAMWYDDVYASSHEYRVPYTKSVYYPCWSVVADRLLSANDPSILDIGCGPGQFAHLLHDKGVRTYCGIDFSREAIRLAKATCPDFDFHVDDIRTSDLLQTHPYDVAVCLEVLEHVDDDLGVICRIRPNTRLIATVPNFDSAAHLRYFETAEDVVERYGPLLDDCSVATHFIDRRSRLFIVEGLTRESMP